MSANARGTPADAPLFRGAYGLAQAPVGLSAQQPDCSEPLRPALQGLPGAAGLGGLCRRPGGRSNGSPAFPPRLDQPAPTLPASERVLLLPTAEPPQLAATRSSAAGMARPRVG